MALNTNQSINQSLYKSYYTGCPLARKIKNISTWHFKNQLPLIGNSIQNLMCPMIRRSSALKQKKTYNMYKIQIYQCLRGYPTPKGNNSVRSSKPFNQVSFYIKINASQWLKFLMMELLYTYGNNSREMWFKFLEIVMFSYFHQSKCWNKI